MRNNSLALVTVIALCINGVGAGLVPLPAAASAPDRNPAALGALPAWFAAMPDGRYPAAGGETSTDDAGPYRLEGPPRGPHNATLDPATLPPSLRPTEAESAPVLWPNPGTTGIPDPLSSGVRLAPANGQGGGTRHRYFVPFNDENLWTLFDDKNTGLPGAQQCHVHDVDVAGSLNSSIFLIASSDGTRYYYDHWEDGYDPDPLDPEQRSDTTEIGILDAGTYKVFQSAIDPGQVGTELPPPHPPYYYYDGRDLITIVGEQAAVVRQVYPETPGTVLAAAWEIPDVGDWGTTYVATVGEDLVSNPGGVVQDHDFAGLEVMAAQPGTEVYYNGALAATLDTVTQTHFIPGANDGAGGGGVDSTDIITATGPIQIQMMTGSCGGARYSAHGYTLQPVDVWDTAYWAPVPGFDPDCGPSGLDADTDVYLHNPHSDAIVVTMSNGEDAYDIPIPAGATVSVLNVTGLDDISTGTGGIQFYSSQPFWGVAVIDSATNGDSEGRNFDWGYSLVAESKLSSHLIVGYAPGSDPPPEPLYGPNGNVAFVTAITDTVLYVDLHQDGLADPFDMNGDGDRDDENVWGVPEWDEPLSALGVPLAAHQVLRVGDPDDHDLTGALIYTLDLEQKIAAAWGQDPCQADFRSPYLDLGYTILPTSIPRLSKTDGLAIDADLSGGVSPGDTITYTLVLHNNGTGVMHNVVLTDPLPHTYVDFVVGSLRVTTPPPTDTVEYYNGTSWVTSPITDAQSLRITWPSIGPGQMVTITFRILIRTDIPPEIVEISNQAVVDSDDTNPLPSHDPDDPDDPDTDTDVGRPLLSMNKRVSPSTVRPGERVTYTLVVSNYGNGVALLTVITDVLPSWTTYVSRTLDLTWPIPQEVITTHLVTYTSSFHGYYADDFDLTATQATDYAGDDGSLEWSADWTEVNDDVPGDPGSGEVRVRMDGNALSEPAHLWMEDADGDDAGVERTMDLSEFVAPTLRYYVSGNTDLDGNDFYRVEIDGISELQDEYGGGYTIQEIDLPTEAAGDPAVTLGLLASGGLEDGEYYHFDHISISESDPFRIMTRVVTETSTVVAYYVTRTGGDPASYDEVTGYMVITEGMRLPAGGFITATFQAQVVTPLTDGLTLRNTACTTASNWINVPVDDGRCDDAEIQVQADHALSITKAATPSPTLVGGLLTYTLNYTMTGDEAVEYMVVSDTTPASTTFHAAAPTPISDPGVGNRGPVIWQVDGLWPPGSGITHTADSLTMVVRVDSSLVSGTLICNTVVITDTSGMTDSDEICTPVYDEPGLDLIKTVEPDRTVPDMPFTYTLRIVNTGSFTFDPLVLTDTLPSDFYYVDESGRPSDPDDITGNVSTGLVLVWQNLGRLEPAASLDVSFQVTTPLTDGTYTNTATVEGVYPGGTLTDTDDAPISIVKPAVAVDKRIDWLDPDEVEPNYVTFTIAIANVGPSTIDVLPLLDEYESYSLTFEYSEPYAVPYPDAVSEVANDGLLTWDDLTGPAPNGFGRNLPPGDTFVVTTVFLITGTGTTTNTAIVTGATDVYGNPADPVEDDEIVANADPALTVLYFRAVAEASAVRLEWATAAEVGIDAFHLYRASDRNFDHAQLIADIGATGRGSTYQYVDQDVTMDQVYWYWLAEVNTDDEHTLHGPVWGGIGPNALPERLYLPLVRRD